MQIDIDCESPCYLSNHQRAERMEFSSRAFNRIRCTGFVLPHSTKLHQLRVALPDPGHLR